MYNTDGPMYREKMTSRAPGASTSLYIKIVLAVVLFVAAFTGVMKFFILEPQMNHAETQMNTQFAACQRALGDYYTNAEAALGIAKANSDQLIKIVQAVATRNPQYVGAGVPGLNTPQSPVYIQLAQAYPNLGNSSDLYKNAEAIMIGDYKNYSNLGNEMSGLIAAFDTQRTGAFGFLVSDFPNHTLRAQVGTETPLYGQAAYDKMSEVITDQNVTTSYDRGYTKPVTP